jgi:microbial collagenase
VFPSRTPLHPRAHGRWRRVTLLAATTALAVGLTGLPGANAATAAAPEPARAAQAHGDHADHADRDHVEHLAKAPKPVAPRLKAPGDRKADGRTPGPTKGEAPLRTLAPCTLDGVKGLGPEQFADFLADPAVTADGCLRSLIWTWDARLAPVMSDAHVQAVSRRATSLAAGHDGRNSSHLLEMFTYLHAVVYHDHSRGEIDVTDAPTAEAMRRAIHYFGTAPRTFDVTRTNAETLREALYTGSAPGLRHSQLDLIRKVLATMDQYHPETHADPSWGGAALAALSVNYLGLYAGNNDVSFRTVVARNDTYREAFRKFAGYTHLKATPNEWVVRDALSEYGRFGEIGSLRTGIVSGLGALLDPVTANWGRGSAPWAKLASWLNHYEACRQYAVCKEDIERVLFPHTNTYDNGAMKVRTGLDRATVDKLYYASKQVKAQYHRVLGSETPLTGDTNSTLNIVLYASRADYENYHPLLTGMDTNNGGIYIERGATFYTYQRRVPQDSSLTLEELFRHEYTHYLNGRWAVPGYFGEGPWYQGDRTTAMDEGTAEFFAGASRDDGVKVRASLVRGIMRDTANGGPRMTVDQLLHATYEGDGFRFYSYAGTFFSFLWLEHPAQLKEMYRHLRANDPTAFDAWRDRLGRDTALQRGYDAFLDEQIAQVDDLFVPDTRHVPVGDLQASGAAEVRSSFTVRTSMTPECAAGGSADRPRFVCTGSITANLTDGSDAGQVFTDMAETVDYFILDRAAGGVNNLADMNCSFGEVTVWSTGRAGTSDYRCEGPLRP